MNKIFKVIWCKSSQSWIAVSELSKVKPVSSVSSVKKDSSVSSTMLKTIAITLPLSVTPLVASAYVAINNVDSYGYATNKSDITYNVQGLGNVNERAVADQASKDTTWAYDYKNPGNKSYYDANASSNRKDGYSSLNQDAYGVAIGRFTNAQNSTGASNGIAIGDWAQARGGLATAIGIFSQAQTIGSTAIGTAARAAGFNSLAMMRQSAAIGDYSAAIGSVAYAKGDASFAFGASATANGDQSIAIGNVAPQTLDGTQGAGNEAQRTRYDGVNNTQSNGARSVAIGSGARTNGDDSFAFGSSSATGGFYKGEDAYLGEATRAPAEWAAHKAIAFGTNATASGNSSIAFGSNSMGNTTSSIAFGVDSKSWGVDAIAFGSAANASKDNSIAFGSAANASKDNSIALGGNAQALHENVITIGKNSKATKAGSMTIGEGAQSNANNSLALGNGTIINQADIKNKNAKYTNDGFAIENGVVAIANQGKERRLVNLAAGREDYDAVNVKQLSEVNDNLAKSIAGAGYTGYTQDASGKYTYKAPEFNIKNQVLNNVKAAVELAQTNYVSVKATVDAKTAGSNYDNKGAQGAGSIALGESTSTSNAAVDSVAIGHNTKVTGKNTVALGANITAATNGSVILGDSSKADGSHKTETVASKTIEGNTYNFKGTAADEGRFVSVGEKGKERQIKNVAAGHVEESSTDAVNGSQLYAVASRVEQGWKITTGNVDGGEVSGTVNQKVAMNDTVKVVAGKNIKVAQSGANITVATKDNVSFTTVTTGGTTLSDNGLTINGGPSVTKAGIDAGSKKVTNVADGAISANSKDAVNGSQLYATNQNVTENAQNIANNAQNITNNANNITKNAENIAKGLNFKGDNAVTVNRQLGDTLNVKGGANASELTDNNIGVVGNAGTASSTKDGNTSGGLTIKLAKDLKNLNSVQTKEIKLGDERSNTTITYGNNRIHYNGKQVATLDDEKHIYARPYEVDQDGNVTLQYVDGNNQVIEGEHAIIQGVAKNDLTNITEGGKTVIKNEAKKAVNVVGGTNTQVNKTDVAGVDTYTVNVAGALTDITSITNKAGNGKVEFKEDGVVNVAGKNTIKLDGNKGEITGLTNKTINGADFAKSGRAATEEQLKLVSDSKIGDNNIKLGGDTGTTDNQALSKTGGLQFNVKGGDNGKYVSTAAAGTDVTVDLTQETKTKIDNAANTNLTNITDEGKKVITGLGTIVKAGQNVTVDESADKTTGQKTYTVNVVAQELGDAVLAYRANGENKQTIKVSKGLNFTDGTHTKATVAKDGVVKYDVVLGETPTAPTDGKNGKNGKDGIATVHQVVDIVNNSGWNANATGNVNGTSVAKTVKPGATVNLDAGKNLAVKQTVVDENQTYSFALNKDLTEINSISNGSSKIELGKDGKTVISGGDVSVSNNKITNVKDGDVNANSKDAVNGSQLHATNQNVTNNANNITKNATEIAKGLNFKGDNKDVTVNRKLGETLNVVGGADTNELVDNNIGVVGNADGSLALKLAKNLNLTDTGSLKIGDTTLNNSGLTITGGPSVTKAGIDAGSKVISNVANGVNDNDAVNVSQLNKVKADERHIKPAEYAVDGEGKVTMTYLDGNGQEVANEKAVITGIAKSDLSNITDEGKKNITKLGTIVEAGSNVVVTNTTDAVTGQKTYTVSAVAQNLGDAVLSYKANSDATTTKTVKVSEGLDFTAGDHLTASVNEKGIVKYEVNLGEAPTVTNGKPGKPGEAGVNGKDGLTTVKTVVDIVNNSGWNANATGNVNGTSVAKTVKPGATVNLDAGKNLTVTQSGNDNNQNYSFALNKDLTEINSISNGSSKIELSKDGKTVISGGDVSVSNNKITDVQDGDVSATSKDAVNGSQLHATNQNVTNNANNITKNATEIAKGLNFKGDNKDVTVNRQLGETLNVVGGANTDELVDNNIGVVGNADGSLALKLAKNLNLTKDGSLTIGETTLNNSGLTITGGPSVTKAGIDAGSKVISNVSEGKAGTDAVNVNQLNNAITSSKTILKDGKNTNVTGQGTVADPYKVNVQGDLTEITSVTGGTGTGKVEFAADQVVNVAGDHTIKLDAKTGDITGLTNVNLDAQDFGKANRAATEEQLSIVNNKFNNTVKLGGDNASETDAQTLNKDGGIKFDVVSADAKYLTTVASGSKVAIDLTQEAKDRLTHTSSWTVKTSATDGSHSGDNEQIIKDGKAVEFQAGKNLTVKQTNKDGNANVEWALADNLTIGKDGKDGVDGSIGVNGKDGSGVAINGKDGSIGLKGKDGENGLTIKSGKGPAGLNGKDGETKTRLIVENESVATLEDGLKFKGDDTTVIAKKLNEQLEIVGGADKDKLTENNIGVNSKDGKLNVQLSKDLNGIETITNGKSSIVLNSNGGTTIKGGDVSVDGNKITNVKAGDVTETSTDAVNGSQLYNVQKNIDAKGLNFGAQSGADIHKNLGEKLEIVGEGTKADDRYDATNIKTMTKDGKIVIGLDKDLTADSVTVGKNGTDGVDGQIGVNGKDGSGVAINGKDGSIGLKGKDGSNEVTIKTEEGPAGVNGKDGKPRLVVNNEKVATLKDGLKFKGDKGDSIAKELNEELEILGQLDVNANVTAKNLRVDNEGGKLILKMAKELRDLTNATFFDETTGNTSVINGNGLTITPKDADNSKTVSVTDKGLNNGGNQIVNVDSGLKNSDGSKVELKDAKGDTLNNAVNVGDLQTTINNITDNGFGLTDENGNDVKAKLGETVTVKGDGSVTTKVIEENGKAKLQVGLNKDVTIGNDKEPGTITVKGENGKDGVSINGKDGTIGLKDEDGKDGIALNGKDGTIGINGKDGSNGSITVKQGQAGLDGNDGKDGLSKTRIVYEKPNGETEEVATLNDGLKFTGNNEVVNSHKLNTLVTIKGEGVDKAASENFKSAAENINVKADGNGTLEVQLAKDLKNIDSISNKDGQKIEFKDGGTTISGGDVSVSGNKITNVKAGEADTDAVNVAQLNKGIAQATTKVEQGKNITVTSNENSDGSTTYVVATADDVDFTSVTTGNTSMNDAGITIKAVEGKTTVKLTKEGLDNGGNKVVNVAEGIEDTDAVNVKQLKSAKTEVEAGDNVVVTQTTGTNGQAVYKVSSVDNTAQVNGSETVTVTKATTTRKDGTTTVTDYNVDLSNKTKDDIKKGVDAHETVTNKGLTFNADKGTTGVKKLGDKVAVNGDNKNIETVADVNGVKVMLKDDISVNSVTAKTVKAGDTTINDNGLTIKNGPSVTKNGIDAGGKRITNVARGVDDTDAVNVSQLKQAFGDVNNRLNKVDKHARAGIAGANAAAGLPQVYQPGKSMVAASAGTFKGQNALAVGYSRSSDNGKVILKLQGNANSQGDIGGSVGIGYQW